MTGSLRAQQGLFGDLRRCRGVVVRWPETSITLEDTLTHLCSSGAGRRRNTLFPQQEDIRGSSADDGQVGWESNFRLLFISTVDF